MGHRRTRIEASTSRLLRNVIVCFLAAGSLWAASWPTSLAAVTFPKSGYVHGVVVDEEGLALGGVAVQVYTSAGALVATTSTGSDGFFPISVEYGTYSIYLTKPGYAKVAKSVPVQVADIDLGTIVLRRALRLTSSTISLVASPGDKVNIPLTVSNTGEDAEVVGFTVSKAEGWSVRLLDQSRETRKVYVSPGQSLSLQLEVTVPSTAIVNADYNVSITAIGTTNSSLTFTVLVQAQPMVTVSGSIVDEYEEGIEGVEINAYSSDGALVRIAITSSDGFFSIELPASSTVSLSFSKKGYVKVTKNVVLKGENVDLGETVLLKTVRLYSSILGLVASPGSKLSIPFVVSNTGGESEVVEFLLSSPEGWSTRILSQAGQEVSRAALSSGASSTFQLEVTIPLSSTGDNALTLATVGGTNSSLGFEIKVQPSTKAVLSSQFPGKSATPGGAVRFQVRVRNPADAEQRFSLSLDPIPAGWTASIKSTGGEAVAEVTLGGNEFVDLVVDVSTPPSVADGRYSLLFTAESSSISEGLPLLVVVERPRAGIELTAVPPYLDVYAGSQARFKLRLSNVGGYDELLNLSVEGLPHGLRAWFEDAAKQEITKVYVEAGQTKEFYVAVSTPKGATLGAQSFTASAASNGLSKTASLTLNVLGIYQVTVTNVNFYTSLNVGGQGTYALTVKNTGSQDITNVRTVTAGSVPDGFTVSVEPTSKPSLRVDEEATFTVTVKTESDVNAGNYYIDFNVLSDQAEARSFTLQVGVAQETGWMIYAAALIVIALVGLFLVYRRFGRR
ncbi:MAG: NEW3 domain-containing protein [Candidatus Bathyarchaeia archaeon]